MSSSLKELTSYFSLTSLPFTKEIPTEALCRLPSLQNALDSAQLLIETRGIGVLLGRSGTGKSCLLRMLEAQLHRGLYTARYLCHSSIGNHEFYTHLCAAFGLPPHSRRATMFRSLKEHLLALNQSQRLHPVLLIDESHLLNTEILQELRLIANFEFDSYNAVTILLCGEERLRMKFGLTILEPLASSITITISLDSLPKEETFSYLEQRLGHCGGSPALFTKNAMELLHQASGGLMRTINAIGQAALLKAFLAKSAQVEAEHVKAVIER